MYEMKNNTYIYILNLSNKSFYPVFLKQIKKNILNLPNKFAFHRQICSLSHPLDLISVIVQNPVSQNH